jgi:hypothetical protein
VSGEQLGGREPTIPIGSPKMAREALCLAQGALREWARMGRDVDRIPCHVARIGELIAEIDKHRPLGPDGKHRDRHTATCGCET